MLDWLRGLRGLRATPRPAAPRPAPEASWTVRVGGGAIEAVDAAGTTLSLPLDRLSRVAIETNDGGPFVADVWWLLFDREGALACGFPQGATGEGGVLDALTALPGFDHEAMIAAMGSTDNAMFEVWTRARGERP